MKKLNLIAILILFSIHSAVFADQGFYIGGGLGYSDLDDACDDIDGSCDDTDTGWKLFAGYQINSYFSVESGYVDLGEADGDDVVLGVPVDFEAEVTGFFLSGLGAWPINDSFNLFGKVGILFWDVETDASGGGVSVSEDESGSDILFGLGAEYSFTDNISARAEWERFNNVGNSETGTIDIDLFSASLIYKF